MRLGRAAIFSTLAATALGLVRCVGDSVPEPDASTDAATNDVVQQQDTGVNDAGQDVANDVAQEATCQPTPQLFAPVVGKGPFCMGAIAGNHCNFGDHCCMNTGTNANTCAATCSGGLLDVACFSAPECDAGLVCCGRGTIQNGVCAYPVISGFSGTACESLCSNEFVACANSSECGSKACAPVRALNEAGTSTTNIQAGACL